MPKKKQHGGPRKNSGRKKKEKTKVMRIPLSKVTEVEKIIHDSVDNTETEPDI